MQKNFGGPILNKNTSQKNFRGGRAFPPRELTCDLREIGIKSKTLSNIYFERFILNCEKTGQDVFDLLTD